MTPRLRTVLSIASALVVAGALAGGALGYLTVSATAGSAGGAVAGSVSRVTALELGSGGVTPTANPNVALTWNTAALASGASLDGYVVRRYSGSNAAQAVGASCSGVIGVTSCTEASVPDGTWSYGVQARFHNWLGAESARLTVRVDTSAPAITAHPASVSASTSASFVFSHATYSTFKCKLDGGSFTTCTSPDALSSLANGTHTFTVEAVDAAGTATQTAASTWTVDTAAPVISSKPAPTSANASPSFAFAAGSYASFECNLDGGGYSACTSPKSYSSLAGGSHTFQVRAKDADGAATAAASYSWTVNAAAPTITSKPSTPSANTAPSFAFNHGTYTSFECNLDGGGFGACSSPRALSGLSDGSHTFQVEAVDADGIATAVAAYTWTVGTAAPTLTGQPANPTAQTSATFSFTDGGYSRFTCTLDGGGATACDTGTAAYAGPLASGSHTFTVSARDADGSQTAARTFTWTVDTTAPALQALQMLDNDHNGKVDHVVATFDETLGSCTAPCTSGWTLSNVPSGGALTSVTVSGTTATLNLAEGSGAANTTVGSFTVALASTSGIADALGNHSSFAAQAPADKAAPVPVLLALGNGSGAVGTGDSASVTFSEPLAVASICSTWSGNTANQTVSGNNNVVVAVADGGAASDTLSAVTAGASSCGGVVHFGTVGLGSAGWVSATTTFSGSGSNRSQVDWTVATSTLKVTLGAPSAAGGTVSGPVTASFTPDAAITDPAGNAIAGSVTTTTKF